MYVGNQWQKTGDRLQGSPKGGVVWKIDARFEGGGRAPQVAMAHGNNMYFNTGSDQAPTRAVALRQGFARSCLNVATTAPEWCPTGALGSAASAVKNDHRRAVQQGREGRG